jgi:hypothetical protein
VGVWEREKLPGVWSSAGRMWLTTFALVGGRGREIFLPLGARTVETAGEKRKEEKKWSGVKGSLRSSHSSPRWPGTWTEEEY